MTDDRDLDAEIDAAVGDEKIEYLEDGIGPNFRVAIAPNGYIWFSIGADLISTQGYCDAKVARAMARMLVSAADEHDKILAELGAQEELPMANNVIDLSAARESRATDEEKIAEEVAAAHDEAVDDAVVAEAHKFD